MTRSLIVPGWGSSGPAHWQSHWERELARATRVEMAEWFQPRRADWIATLDRAIRGAGDPVVLVAHSLGCLAVAHWAAADGARRDGSPPVLGALLVAPADVDRPGCPDHLRDFAPAPREPLPFSSRVVAGSDDPYASLAWSREIAAAWRSDLVVLAGAGHINAASGFGPWPEGRRHLESLGASSILDTAAPPTIDDRASEASESSVVPPLAATARR